jgi:hypothetical protein
MDPASKAYMKAECDLENLLNGHHQRFRDTKFTVNDITWAMDQFASMVHNKLVAPANKGTIKRINVSSFIYNHYAKHLKSYFAHLIDNDTVLLPKVKEDINPKLTQALIAKWRKEMLHGLTYDMGGKEKQSFIDASHRISTFLDKNKNKIQWLMLNRGPKDIANLLWKSIENTTQHNLTKVTPYWLGSDLTLELMMRYMAQKGYVKPTNEWN